MKRIEVIEEVVGSPLYSEGALIVSNIGYCSRELYSLADKPQNFYMLGSMGLASSIGLGLSIVQGKRQIVVLEGDGSILMNLGTFATIANFAPTNFHLLVIDNHAHGSTGNQKSVTGMRTDLLNIAKGSGILKSVKVVDRKKLRDVLNQSKSLPTVIVAECQPGNADVPFIPLSAARIKSRFIQFLSGITTGQTGVAKNSAQPRDGLFR